MHNGCPCYKIQSRLNCVLFLVEKIDKKKQYIEDVANINVILEPSNELHRADTWDPVKYLEDMSKWNYSEQCRIYTT